MWPLVHMYRYLYLQGVNLEVTCWVSTCSAPQNKTKPHSQVDATINIKLSLRDCMNSHCFTHQPNGIWVSNGIYYGFNFHVLD